MLLQFEEDTFGKTFYLNSSIAYAIYFGSKAAGLKLRPSACIYHAQLLSWYISCWDPCYEGKGIPLSTERIQQLTLLSRSQAKRLISEIKQLELLQAAGIDHETTSRLYLPGKALEDGRFASWVSMGAREAGEASRARREVRLEEFAAWKASKEAV